jgi:hypothetical protein
MIRVVSGTVASFVELALGEGIRAQQVIIDEERIGNETIQAFERRQHRRRWLPDLSKLVNFSGNTQKRDIRPAGTAAFPRTGR